MPDKQKGPRELAGPTEPEQHWPRPAWPTRQAGKGRKPSRPEFQGQEGTRPACAHWQETEAQIGKGWPQPLSGRVRVPDSGAGGAQPAQRTQLSAISFCASLSLSALPFPS